MNTLKSRIVWKYGLLITAGVILWVVVAHSLVPDPRSPVHGLGSAVFFNLAEISGILFGLKAKRREKELSFKEGLKTGVAIAFVYALTAGIFFAGALLVVGPTLMAGEPGAGSKPLGQILLGAFAGLFLGAIVLGLIYSTIISFLLARSLHSRS